MPRLLQIAQIGNPILREKAQPIDELESNHVQELIDDMLATLADTTTGLSLAAPQVYAPLRIFIMGSRPTSKYPTAPDMKPTVIINPEILAVSDKMNIGWEGCLSIPGLRGKVRRHKEIQVAFIDRKGRLRNETFDSMLAVIFQHEFDHLEGKVFLYRMESSKDLATEKEFLRTHEKD
ncbi:Def: peptide deformylase [Desulfosarcina variabilis str. Montpellier]